MHLLGSARVSRVGVGVLAIANFPTSYALSTYYGLKRLLRRDTATSTRDACATQSANRTHHAIFFRNRKAQRTKSKIDIKIRMARFGQYSKKYAPRRMIARMSAMK